MLSCFHHFTFKCKKAKWNQCLIVHQMIERKRWRLLQCNNGSLKDFKTEQRGQYCAITCFVWNHIVWNEFWSKSLNPINRSGIIGLVWKKDALIIKRQLDRPMMASKVRGIPEAGNRKGTESGPCLTVHASNNVRGAQIPICGVPLSSDPLVHIGILPPIIVFSPRILRQQCCLVSTTLHSNMKKKKEMQVTPLIVVHCIVILYAQTHTCNCILGLYLR